MINQHLNWNRQREQIQDDMESDMGTASDDLPRPVYTDDETCLIELQDG